jgi:hypothetical protein
MTCGQGANGLKIMHDGGTVNLHAEMEITEPISTPAQA